MGNIIIVKVLRVYILIKVFIWNEIVEKLYFHVVFVDKIYYFDCFVG